MAGLVVVYDHGGSLLDGERGGRRVEPAPAFDAAGESTLIPLRHVIAEPIHALDRRRGLARGVVRPEQPSDQLDDPSCLRCTPGESRSAIGLSLT